MLAAVRGVNVEFVVVNSDFGVRISRGNGYLDVGGEEARGRDVEGVDGGVLEDEVWFCWSEDEPNEEDDE